MEENNVSPRSRGYSSQKDFGNRCPHDNYSCNKQHTGVCCFRRSAYTDPTSRRDFLGERFLRPLFWHLSQSPELGGEPRFSARDNTPGVNGLSTGLLLHNTNSHSPFRLSRSQNYTCDQNHDYTPEQQAVDSGLMDKFVQFLGVGTDGTCPDYGFGTVLVMGYYDGNTVTTLWNYAQHYALNDNSYGTMFGSSTPGALNLVSGRTAPYDAAHTIGDISGDVANTSVVGDPDPFYDDCGNPEQLAVTGRNIGDILNAKGITWGWFQGGFKPTTPASAGSSGLRGNVGQSWRGRGERL